VSNHVVAAGPALAFELALVCTGNQIRSPIAEALVGRLAATFPIATQSMGLVDIGREPPPREAIEVAAGLGLDISMHRSRRMEPLSLQESDLVVGFELVHVAAAVLDGGARAERTFMLRELVELLEQVDVPEEDNPATRARLAVAVAHERRGALSGRSAAAPVNDPLGRGRGAYRSAARELGELVPRLVDGLFRPRPLDSEAAR